MEISYFWSPENIGEFVGWFWSLPLFGQVLVVAGIVAILAMVAVLVYYIIKAVAYLVYYVLKGGYYLIKGAILGAYRLLKWLYYAISGQEKPVKKEYVASEQLAPVKIIPVPVEEKAVVQDEQPQPKYCSGCGCELSSTMVEQLSKNGVAFCAHCGEQIAMQEILIRPVSSNS